MARGQSLAGLALLAIGSATGCEPGATTSTTGAAIVGGQPASDVAIVSIGLRRSLCDQPPSTVCSGVLIAPRVVLTAAHCLDGFEPDAIIEVLLGDALTGSAVAGHYSRLRQTHPEFDPDTRANDLALLLLDEPASAAVVSLPTAPLDQSSVGAMLRIVGFGATQPGGNIDGTKRESTSRITAIDSASIRTEAAPGLICDGDSGGPAFLEGDPNVLVGIASGGDPLCESFGVHIPVQPYVQAFIQPFIDDHSMSQPPVADPIANDALCLEPCAEDSDCPHGMRCVADADAVFRCTLDNLPSGNLAETCTSTEDPCRPCVRLTANGTASCRVLDVCSGAFLPECEKKEDGCCAAGGSSTSAHLWLLVVLVLLRRRR